VTAMTTTTLSRKMMIGTVSVPSDEIAQRPAVQLVAGRER